MLVLAGGGAQGQSVQYASCVKGWIALPTTAGELSSGVVVPICYCLISERPFLPFFRDVLMRLLGANSVSCVCVAGSQVLQCGVCDCVCMC